MDMTARRRRAREKSVRSRISRAKALRRLTRAAGSRRTVSVTAAAAVSLAGGALAPAVSPAAAVVPTRVVAQAVEQIGARGSSVTCDPRTPARDPSELTDLRGTLFFSADDGIHGQELWKSDGTKAGTVLVKDIHPGTGDYYDDPLLLTAVSGALFFAADDGVHGDELWKSDGTETGTVLVKDIRPGDAGSIDYDVVASSLTDVPGTVFFTADDGVHDQELWRSDGTEAGTVLVKDIRPGDYGSDSSLLTSVGGTLFFTARDGIHGRELWKSDGTDTGTVMVKDIHPGGGSSYDRPSSLTAVGGSLFFVVDDGTHGEELWKSDGAEAGTVMVEDVNAGGGFTVASKVKADTAKGTVTVTVAVAGGGRLVARPAAGSELRKSARTLASAGKTTITLRPTRAGMRILRHAGSLRVKARFTFTPCSGTGSSVVRPFTLRLK